jgi:hypothetical protein
LLAWALAVSCACTLCSVAQASRQLARRWLVFMAM